ETVEKIQDGRLDPTARIDFIPGGVDPIKHPLTGHKTPILQDPDRTFTEWINTQPFIFRGRRFGRVGEPPTDEDLDGGVNQ
ncbi:hypothetical protein, partial [Halorubrum sp. SP3]